MFESFPQIASRLNIAGRRQLFVVLGCIAGLLLIIIFKSLWPKTQPPGSQPTTSPSASDGNAPVPPIEAQAIRQKAWHKIRPRLDAANRASEDEIERCVERVDEFFDQRKKGTPAFAEKVLSLKGKWQFIHSRLPKSDASEHLKYLEEQFGEHVFKPEDLKNAVESSVAGYVKAVQGIENQLLVNCRQDISDSDPLAQRLIPQIKSQKDLGDEFQRLLDVVSADVSRDLRFTVGREVVVFAGAGIAEAIFTRVGAALATELAIDSTLATVGTMSSVQTLGISMVAMIVVDIAVDWLEKLAGHDPAADVAAKVDGTLDKIESLLVDGDPEAIRVYRRLRRLESGDPK